MGQQTSRDELLFQQVSYGNVEGIRSLAREGAALEWVDKDGKTALIHASMNPELLNVVKALIDLGANINAYRPGRNAGTPLHHAAKRGIEPMVGLLLSHGANALAINDDCQTPLEVARAKGFTNVVRLIENHICLFSGWMREFVGPEFLEALAPTLVSRKVWAVIIPSGSRNHLNSLKLELALYNSAQNSSPRTSIQLWKANLDQPKFHQADPSVTILLANPKTRVKLAAAIEGDKAQLQWFCDACKGAVTAHVPAFLQLSNAPAAAPHNVAVAPSAGFGLASSVASAPPAEEFVDISSVRYPEVDLDPVCASPGVSDGASGSASDPLGAGPQESDSASGSGTVCSICMDAPVEGACIPCGHMAGCMACLNDVQAKKFGCPVCRAKIDKVLKLYAV